MMSQLSRQEAPASLLCSGRGTGRPGRGSGVPNPPGDPAPLPRPRGRPKALPPPPSGPQAPAGSAAGAPEGPKPAPVKLALPLDPSEGFYDSRQPFDSIPAQPSALHYVPVVHGPRPSVPVILHSHMRPGSTCARPRMEAEPVKKRVLPSRRNSAQHKTLREEEVHHSPPTKAPPQAPRDRPRERRDPSGPPGSKPADAVKPVSNAR